MRRLSIILFIFGIVCLFIGFHKQDVKSKIIKPHKETKSKIEIVNKKDNGILIKHGPNNVDVYTIDANDKRNIKIGMERQIGRGFKLINIFEISAIKSIKYDREIISVFVLYKLNTNFIKEYMFIFYNNDIAEKFYNTLQQIKNKNKAEQE